MSEELHDGRGTTIGQSRPINSRAAGQINLPGCRAIVQAAPMDLKDEASRHFNRRCGPHSVSWHLQDPSERIATCAR